MSRTPINIVFTDYPGPDDECVFVEIEDDTGRALKVGQWRRRPDGLVALRITALPKPQLEPMELVPPAAYWRTLGPRILAYLTRRW